MIPILYESNETAFTSQGIGALAESTSASVSRVLNGKDELVLVYPCTGVRYADLQNDRIIFAQPEYKKSAQPYQIYKITKPLNGLVTVYARHVGTQRAKYIPVAPFQAGSVIQVFNDLPTYLKESNPFTFWTNKDTVANFKLTIPASLGNVLGGMEGSILDVYGGEYEFDGYTIKLWGRRGSDSGVELRYGKNITDIEHNEDFDGIVTGVAPYWEGMDNETVYLPEIVVEGAYADQYSFRRSIIKDFSEIFEEKPTEAQLRAAAQNYIAQTGISLPKVDLSVNFEHLAQYTEYEGIALLEQLNLGDSVSIYYEPLGVSATARIVKTNYDCLTEKYISVQIGSVKNDLAQIMSAQANTAQELKNAISKTLPSAIEEAVEHVTDLITGAEGGYVVLDRDANGKPYQILIMDTDSKNTATNVIRLNQNGIGFSTSGYSGPYTTAWTIDSNFVADFITTGNFNASLAKIGTLQDAAGKNSWNMQTGAFNITNGSINITTANETVDKIILSYNQFTNKLSPLEVRVTNTDTDRMMLLQAGALFAYDISDPNNEKSLLTLGSALNIFSDINGTQTVTSTVSKDAINIYNGINGSAVNTVNISKYGVMTLGATGTGSEGAGAIRLNGSVANIAVLSAEVSGGVLTLKDNNGVFSAKLGVNRALTLTDANGTDIAELGTATNRALFLKNTSGQDNVSLYGTNGAFVFTDQTHTLSYTPGSALQMLNGTSKYSFLVWPDSNGAGRVVLGDGTGTLWRTTLENTGLTFRNSSDAVTAQYRCATAGVSWYQARDAALLRDMSTPPNANAWWPALDMKTPNGDWSIGRIGENMFFSYVLNSNYSSATNTSARYSLPAGSGGYTYQILTENTGALKPVHISGSARPSVTGTTYKYSGVSFTVPADRYFTVTAHAYYSSVSPSKVCISDSSTAIDSGHMQIEANVDSQNTRARCTWTGYLSAQTTYYVWVQGVATGNIGVGIDGFYFA